MNSIKYILILLLFVSCKKDEIDPNSDLPANYSNGILVLNEGLFQQNNSTLSWIDLNTNEVKQDVFLNTNNRLLGDTGNDLQRYGGKIYIVVNASSTVEVLDAATLKSIKQIQLNFQSQGQQPRRIAFWNDKAYVSSYDGYVNIIDTNSLTLINRISVGQNPEGLAVMNDHLYVANSGGLSFPNVDSTVFKIDLNTNQILDTFVVGENPGDVISDGNENIYVVKRGDFGANPSELVKINVSTATVEKTSLPASTLTREGSFMYISYYNYNTNNSSVSLFDLNTETVTNSNLIGNNDITTLYGSYSFKNDQVVCLDATNFTNTGALKIFSNSGSLLSTYEVGLNPNKILIYE
jgi:hypothetical protein